MAEKKFLEKTLTVFQQTFFRRVGVKFRASPLRNFMNKVFEFLEKILYKFEIFSSNYLKMYDEIVRNEIELADIKSNDSILVIGCGALPATAACIAIKTKAKVTAIDIDKKAVKNAKKYIKRLNLEEKIKIEYADGVTYLKKDFDVIFVLYGVSRQEKILNNNIEDMKDNVRIIYRMPSDLKEKISNGDINLSDSLTIKNCVRSKTLNSVDSYLLTKK